MITNQILRCLPIRRGFSKLLRHPGIGGRSYHSRVDHASRFELDDDERKARSKEEICYLLFLIIYQVSSDPFPANIKSCQLPKNC